MKTTILVGIFSFLISLSTSGQLSGPITIEKKGLKKTYYQSGQSIDSKRLVSILKSSQVSEAEYQASKLNGIIGLSSITCGTVFIGVGFYYTLKSAQAVNDNDLIGSTDYSNKSAGAMLIGAGFYVVSLPFILMSNSHLKKSINLYNSSTKTGSINKMNMNVGFTGNGAMLQLRF